jgi:hypothetical protein
MRYTEVKALWHKEQAGTEISKALYRAMQELQCAYEYAAQ